MHNVSLPCAWSRAWQYFLTSPGWSSLLYLRVSLMGMWLSHQHLFLINSMETLTIGCLRFMFTHTLLSFVRPHKLLTHMTMQSTWLYRRNYDWKDCCGEKEIWQAHKDIGQESSWSMRQWLYQTLTLSCNVRNAKVVVTVKLNAQIRSNRRKSFVWPSGVAMSLSDL